MSVLINMKVVFVKFSDTENGKQIEFQSGTISIRSLPRPPGGFGGLGPGRGPGAGRGPGLGFGGFPGERKCTSGF